MGGNSGGLGSRLCAGLAAWKNQPVWFTERLIARGVTSFAQQRFSLRHVQSAPGHIHITGRWGHDLSVLTSALHKVEIESRCISATERFDASTSRVRHFRRLTLRDEASTPLSATRNVLFHEGFEVKSLGAEHQWAAWDNLAIGGSSLSPAVHAQRRKAVARDPDVVPPAPEELLQVLRDAGHAPVVFWVGASLREQLGFWCACHTIASGHDGPLPGLWCAAPATSGERERLSVLLPESLAAIFCEATPLSPRALQVFAAKWRAFCNGRHPTRAAVARWPRSKGWMLRTPEDFDAQLERVRGRAVLPSKLDLELLAPFTKWKTPMAVVSDAERADFCFRLLGADEALLGRLHAWSTFGSGRYLEERATDDLVPFKRFEYRLTKAGLALLLTGVRAATELPSFPWGGFRRSRL